MSDPNWANQTVFTGDNLPVMRAMNSESVDLIYLDPPFNSKRDYAAAVGSQAAGAGFSDTWTLRDVDPEWVDLIESRHPAIHRVLLAATTDSDKSYLIYMAVRLLEMRRLLKATGSIWLHCDPTMSHYLKLVMDTVFGRDAFRNEIVWRRTAGTKNDPARFPRDTDRLLYYTRGRRPRWNGAATRWTQEQIDKWYTLRDERGVYMRLRLRSPSSHLTLWRGLRHGTGDWNAPRTGKDAEWVEREFIPGYRNIDSIADRLEALDTAGLLHWPKKPGGLPTMKRYLKYTDATKPVPDWWMDIPGGRGIPRNESVGYPTQKPLALLNRIIAASSDPGDMVIDPFAGCATTMVAAESLGRRWAGIDLSPETAELAAQRISDRHGLFSQIVHRADLPHRTDLGTLPAASSVENRKFLYSEQGGRCAGCCHRYETYQLEVAHIIAPTKKGTDHVTNLQLLCPACNQTKHNRGIEYLRTKLQLTVRLS